MSHNELGYTKSGRRPDLVKHVPARRSFHLPNLRRVRAQRKKWSEAECSAKSARPKERLWRDAAYIRSYAESAGGYGGILHLTQVNVWCIVFNMPTNLAIDDRLLNEAKKVGKFASKKETVNEALKEFIERRKQKAITKLFNSVEYDANYDYKKLRNRKVEK